MKKIELYKDNELVEKDLSDVTFDEKEVTLTIRRKEHEIHFNFKKKTCQFILEKMNMNVTVEVTRMDYHEENGIYYLNYTLISEPGVKNTVKIY